VAARQGDQQAEEKLAPAEGSGKEQRCARDRTGRTEGDQRDVGERAPLILSHDFVREFSRVACAHEAARPADLEVDGSAGSGAVGEPYEQRPREEGELDGAGPSAWRMERQRDAPARRMERRREGRATDEKREEPSVSDSPGAKRAARMYTHIFHRVAKRRASGRSTPWG
jgi:hypothetical protein